MRITITIEDLGKGEIRVVEAREPGPEEKKSTETPASITSDVLFLIMQDMDHKRLIHRDNTDD